MRDLNFILENAWKYRDDPEKLIWTFQRVFEEYRENPIYLFEYANALDFLGKESEAIPLYQQALSLGISGKRKIQAEIQLGSSFSVLGDHVSAITILSRLQKETGDPAALIFLCIALFRSEETKRSLKTALSFIMSGKHGLLPKYTRALSQYLDEIN